MSNQMKVRCMLDESIAFVDVDRVYDGMDEGNKQHMANKLWKHGWIPAKAARLMTEDELAEAAQTRRAETYKFLTEDDVKPGDFVRLVKSGHYRDGGLYVVSKVDSGGTLRLINPENGACWSHTALFNSYHTDGQFIMVEENEE